MMQLAIESICDAHVNSTQKTQQKLHKKPRQDDNWSRGFNCISLPYASIIPYSKERIEGDLSNVHSIKESAEEIKDVACLMNFPFFIN